MVITDVQIELTGYQKEQLRAYCHIVIDDAIVIRDIRILALEKGFLVAMPNRRSAEPCAICSARNHFMARFCSQCGQPMVGTENPPRRIYRDIVHPISARARRQLEAVVLAAYEKELEADRARNAMAEGKELRATK